MSMLSEQLLKMERHNSLFESAVRTLPLPVCAAFGDAARPQPVAFAAGGRVLGTRDGAQVAASFPHSVQASGNVVLAGRTLGELDLSNRFEIMIVAIRRSDTGDVEFNPRSAAIFHPGDVLISMGRPDHLGRFDRALSEGM